MKFQFVEELVTTKLAVHNQVEAIERVAKPLIQAGFVSDQYPNLVLKREEQYPTGLVTKGAVIAIPHSFDEGIKGNHVAIGILEDSVPFQNMEDVEQSVDVKIIFMLAISKANEQLEMLQILMQMFKEEHLLKQLTQMSEAKAICNRLNSFVTEMLENKA